MIAKDRPRFSVFLKKYIQNLLETLVLCLFKKNKILVAYKSKILGKLKTI